MGQNTLSIKRKVPPKQDRAPKRPRTVLETVVGLEAEGVKTVTPAKHGVGKGFMKDGPHRRSHPFYSERTLNTPWRRFHPSYPLKIMRT